ncbi:MAG: hypothetical protein ACK5PB_05330 [Pirellula sp.]|jgi:hypothetical protein
MFIHELDQNGIEQMLIQAGSCYTKTSYGMRLNFVGPTIKHRDRYYDTLEVLEMRRKQCVIVYIDEHQQSQTVKNVIIDVFAKGIEEFIRLETGQWIRLDQLLVVDQRAVPLDSCPMVYKALQLR